MKHLAPGPARPGRTIPADPWLEHLVRQLPVARAGEDAEGVHQVRVAVARLQVWLALGQWVVLQDDLRWLRRHAASVRDLDVHLAALPPKVVEARLRRELGRARAELLAALNNPRLQGLLLALALLPAPSRAQAERYAARLAKAVLRRGRRAFERPGDLPALHALRRAARRLRYALEWLGESARPVVELQDALGRAGDRIVALRHVDRMARAGHPAHAYRRRLEAELRHHAAEAKRRWVESRSDFEEAARWKSS